MWIYTTEPEKAPHSNSGTSHSTRPQPTKQTVRFSDETASAASLLANSPSGTNSAAGAHAPQKHPIKHFEKEPALTTKRQAHAPAPKHHTRKYQPQSRLFVLLYLLGMFASGFFLAAMPQQTQAFLQKYLHIQVSAGTPQPFELFLQLFIPAIVQVAAVSVLSLCAVGAPLLGAMIALSGLACGTTVLLCAAEYGWKGLVYYCLVLGGYHAVTGAVLCRLGEAGRITAGTVYSNTFRFKRNATAANTQSPLTAAIFRPYLTAIICLTASCGLFAATAKLCQTAAQTVL